MDLRGILPLAIIGLILSLFVPPALADPVADFEAMRQSQQRNIDQSIANMPPLAGHEDHQLGKIFHVGMEGLNLIVRTPMDSTLVPSFTRAKVAEFPQPIMVRIVGGADRKKHADGEWIVPDELLFQYADYSKPRLITATSLSQSGSVIFSLSRSQTSPGGSRSVQFVLQNVPTLPNGGGVTLVVNEAGFRTDLPHSSVTLAAPDCATFLRRHPREVSQHIMPLLAELGQEGVFAPDALLAMQVFPEQFSVDAAVRKRVEALLKQLESSDYHQRDQATEELEKMGQEAAKAIVYLDRARFTPEQNSRIDRALTPVGLISRPEADRLRHDREFLINCLYCDDSVTRRSAIAEIKSLTGVKVDVPDGMSREERTAAMGELRRKFDVSASRPSAE